MANGWRIPTDAEDYFRQTEKRITRQERRASPLSTLDILGGGMAAQAVQIMDWSDEYARFNGFYYSSPGAINSPEPSLSWAGQVIAKDDGSGMQQVWNTDGLVSLYWVRTYEPTPVHDGNVIFGAWKKFSTASGLIGETEIDQIILDNIQQAIDGAALVRDDFDAVQDQIEAGDSANAQTIDLAVQAMLSQIATKSKNTDSADPPGTTPNNLGDTWRQYEGDPTNFIGQWRGAGGTTWIKLNLSTVMIPKIHITDGTFGTFDGGRIVANSILASSMIVSDFTNHITDSECTGVGWILNGGAYISMNYQNLHGINDGVIVHPPNSTFQVSNSNMFRVFSEQYYNVAFDWSGIDAPSGKFVVRLQWYNKLLTALDFEDLVIDSGEHEWATRSGNTQAPPAAAWGKIQIIRFNAATSGSYLFDNVAVRRRFGGELVVDGTVYARHITADMVNGLLFSGPEGAPNGAAFQTNMNGPTYPDPYKVPTGIKMSQSGLVGYNSSGVPKFVLNATTGEITSMTVTSAIITGALIKTATSGNRLEMLNEFQGGKIVGYSGRAGETPAKISCGINTINQQTWQIATGLIPGSVQRAGELYLASAGTSGMGTRLHAYVDKAEFTGDVDVDGVVNGAGGGVFAGNGVTVVGGLNVSSGGATVNGTLSVSNSVRTDVGFWDLADITPDATNVKMYANGHIVRGSVSSERYKEAIEPMTVAQAEETLALDAVTFQWRNVEESGIRRVPGFIAEQADAAGLDLWVTYDLAGRPNGFRYAELVAAQQTMIKDLYRRLALLEGP